MRYRDIQNNVCVLNSLQDPDISVLKSFFNMKEKAELFSTGIQCDVGRTVLAGVKTSDTNMSALVRTLAWLS